MDVLNTKKRISELEAKIVLTPEERIELEKLKLDYNAWEYEVYRKRI